MCGYFGNLHESPVVIDLMNQLGLKLPYPTQRANAHQDARRNGLFDGLITAGGDGYEMSSGLWWFDIDKETGRANFKRTSFNARNLDSSYWKASIRRKRGLVFATELGESQGSKKYLMKSETGMALGIVYNDWEIDDGSTKRSFAVITRDPHERFAHYHEKAMPLFLPPDIDVLKEWLNPDVDEKAETVQWLLNSSTLFYDLEVTPVKTYVRGEPLGDTETLDADDN